MKIRLANKILTSKKPYWVKKKHVAWQMICCKKYPVGVDNRMKMAMDWYLRKERKKREKILHNQRWSNFNACGRYFSPYNTTIMPVFCV